MQHTQTRHTCLLALALSLAACGDLEADAGPELDSGSATGLLDAGTNVGFDGAVATVVSKQLDTTSSEVWVYLDLETGESRTLATPPDWSAWDLKLSRFKVATHGGASGEGQVTVALSTSKDFAALTTAPRETYSADTPDGPDSDLEPDYVIATGDSTWYAYDPTTHTLSPNGNVYVVRSQEGAFFKLVIEGYYNQAGSPGYLQLRWAALTPPDGPLVGGSLSDAGVDVMSSASKAR